MKKINPSRKKLFSMVFFIFLFANCHAQWYQIGQDLDGELSMDESGNSTSMSADGLTVAVGAYRNDGGGNLSGHVRVFQFIGGAWIQQGQDIDGEATDDSSGDCSLSADGLTVAVGAEANDGNGSNSGHVRVYKLIAGTWVQQGQDIDGEAADDWSGGSVSMSADGLIVAIGAEANDGNGSKAGHVRVYKLIGGTWVQQGQDIDGEAAGDGSGRSVSMSDDGLTVAIGATGNEDNGYEAGHTRVYKFTAGSWVQQGQDIDGEAAGDGSGASVSISADGLQVAIGAAGNDANGSDAGHTRVYKLIAGTWTQQGQDIDGEAADDWSGLSVSLSADGLIVAIGASGNDGNGNSAGHVRVYQLNGGAWIQQEQDIDGESSSDYSGLSVSSSADGLIVAIGAFWNDDNGPMAGHTRVYQIDELDLIENTLTDKFNVYPNPTHGLVKIEFETKQEHTVVKLFSNTGQVLQQQEMTNSNGMEMEIRQDSGLYFLEFFNDSGQRAIMKIVKE